MSYGSSESVIIVHAFTCTALRTNTLAQASVASQIGLESWILPGGMNKRLARVRRKNYLSEMMFRAENKTEIGLFNIRLNTTDRAYQLS
jgi:hypothetical protein